MSLLALCLAVLVGCLRERLCERLFPCQCGLKAGTYMQEAELHSLVDDCWDLLGHGLLMEDQAKSLAITSYDGKGGRVSATLWTNGLN